MTAYGLSFEGFTPKTLEVIKSEIEEDLRNQFGANIDLRPQSVFGQLVGIFSEKHAEVWALANDVYLSQYPDFASGVQLDRVASITATVRKPATPSQASVVCYGVQGTVLSAGQEVQDTLNNLTFETVDAVTISALQARDVYLNVVTVGNGAYTVTINGIAYTYTASGSPPLNTILNGLVTAIGTGVVTPSNVNSQLRLLNASVDFSAVATTANLAIARRGSAVNVIAQENGAFEVPVGVISEINTPISGWDSVSNLLVGVTGQDRETDEELRIRRTASVDRSIRGAVLAVDNVTQAVVYENNTDVTDGDGTPAHHIWAIVEGGSNLDIAEAIISRNSAGIGTRGAVVNSVTSPVTGNPTTVKFDRPTTLNPTIAVGCVLAEDGTAFPTNGVALIKQALEDYTDTFTMGQDLVYSRLFGVIHSVGGIQVNTLTINGASTTLTATKSQIIKILVANVTVTGV
jgi:uncharacterized phage protein gp47/JayE